MLTASIVLFNTPKVQLDRLLSSIMQSNCVSQLYIIDNSPNDKFRILEKTIPVVRYIHNANLGYGAAHNIAIKEAIEEGSDYHVVLNPDVYFSQEVLPALLQYMDEHSDTVYLLPKVLYPNGDIQYLCKLLPTPLDLIFRRFFPGKLAEKQNYKYTLRQSGYDKIINPPCLSGCFMFLRVETLRKYQLFFDESFFMYCEDFDLMRRLHRVGKTIFFPNVSIIHDHGKESYKNRKMLLTHIKSACTYFNKYGWFFDKERRCMNSKIIAEIESLVTNNTDTVL